ncbi:RDD family protein [Streptomyces sp. NPDC092296]|uniref:RDD family protein n=1 Tax=Streptomyces sp. NPDC092296 TaxID=3366012 RepID=UPI0037F66C00
MTDRPSSGSTAGAPAPGYYPDPSIPGYVRYWDGRGWAPGTSRRAPGPGEVLPAPRVVARRAAPSARSVPPPVAAAPVAAEDEPEPGGVAWAEPTAVERSGPVFFDETTGGTSFTTGPRTGAMPSPALPARRAPEPADPATPPPAPPAAPRRPAAPVPPPPVTTAADAVAAPAAHADPEWPTGGRQRGPADPQAAPRWVSWGAVETGAGAAPAPERRRTPAWAAGAPTAPTAVARTAPARTAATRPAATTRTATTRTAAVPPPTRATAPAPAPGPAAAAARPQGADRRAAPPAGRRAARPAGYGRRLFARLVDGLVVAALATAAGVPLAAAAVHHLQAKIDAARESGRSMRIWLVDPTVLGQAGGFLAVLLLIGFLYEVLPTARSGRTLGKRLARIRVLDAAARRPPGLGGALRRWLAQLLLGAVLLPGFLDLLWCLLDRPLRQCWHDKAGGTFVASDG